MRRLLRSRGDLATVFAAVAVAVSACGQPVSVATWRIDPAARLVSTSRSIPLLVQESGCASGAPATGRIVTRVTYTADSVDVVIRVRSRGGDQTCQGVETPYVLELREPLGDRPLRDPHG